MENIVLIVFFFLKYSYILINIDGGKLKYVIFKFVNLEIDIKV